MQNPRPITQRGGLTAHLGAMVDDEFDENGSLFERLCHNYVDGVLDEIGMRQLVRELMSDADLRHEFQMQLFMHEALKRLEFRAEET